MHTLQTMAVVDSTTVVGNQHMHEEVSSSLNMHMHISTSKCPAVTAPNNHGMPPSNRGETWQQKEVSVISVMPSATGTPYRPNKYTAAQVLLLTSRS